MSLNNKNYLYDKIMKKGKFMEKKPNKQQQECIDNLDGKYLVLAGPGTGKTFTVIKRLQAMINKGVDPERILCLTYTVAAANEMKKRVLEQLDESKNNVEIHTYHSFCNKIMTEYIDEFDLPEGFKVIPNTVKNAYLKECIDEKEDIKYYKSEKANPYTKIESIEKGIGQLKHQRISSREILDKYIKHDPEWLPRIAELEMERDNNPKPRKNYANHIKTVEEKIEKVHELYDFYEMYKAKMEKDGYIDFEDMINFILEKFETSPVFVEEIASRYDYLLVDEYQDTNKTQNELIFHLVDNIKTGNVFVVGDDEQIVNASQGARLDNIEKFKEKYPEIKPIIFKENRRSTQNILDVARTVANQSEIHLDMDRTLIAKNEEVIKKGKKVRLNIYTNLTQQNNDIVNEIDALVNSDECPVNEKGEKDYSQIAIIATGNEELAEFSKLLHNRNIPYELKYGKDIFLIKSSVILYYYLQTIVNPKKYSDKLFKLLMLPPFNVDPESFMKIYDAASRHKTFIEAIDSLKEEDKTEEIKKFITVFRELDSIKKGETVYNFVMKCAAKTGLFEFFLNCETNRTENILGLQTLLNEASAFSEQYRQVTLEEFVEYLEMASANGICAEKFSENMNAVQLTTYQSSKGKEYEYVYMPTLQKSKWESNGTPPIKPSVPVAYEDVKTSDEWDKFKKADKLNKMYVGMTRAKHTLRLSYYDDGSAVPTEFLKVQELAEKDLIEVKKFESNEIEELVDFAKNAWILNEYDYTGEFNRNVDGMLEDKEFAPTYVNDYIKCPRMFFYSRILDINPKYGEADNMSFGSAVHKACEDATKYALDNGKYYDNAEPFIESFLNELATRPVSTFKQRTYLEGFGSKMLKDYYENTFIKTPIEKVYAAEKKIKTELDGIKVQGYIDRIDLSGDTFEIYDYKTGKAKTKKDICPDGEHEDYYNQMGLYKYFLEQTEGKKVSKAAFIFPQENKELVIEYTDEITKEIFDKFKKAIEGMKAHKFEPTPKEVSCKYCPYNCDICEVGIQKKNKR